ncbi:uncharacterized protein LOC116193087 isoform X2 [Punica granatum]|uniref:Uncharacterized protein LOC116193087 isoform X2 n=1 Tax=Punica granatum TaxID=22663 RepID=A0A218X978_PUNGR|nr:uncharacterized protein LOC116193087 isoform X2 [Punica granatum]OWM81775.1 hypothetical protein CDL15_Pgr007813 [Punica granatum]
MEELKEVVSYSSSPSSSSTSFPAELFGLKLTTPSSSPENVFSSIFPPPSKVQAGEFPKFELNANKQYFVEDGWNIKPVKSEDNLKSNQSGTQSIQKEDASYIYQERNLQPMNLSSSIYYGGREMYSNPNNKQDPALNFISLENNGEDDSGSASRGDWWQGSLYY